MKDRIKRIRQDAGLTQQEFAKRIGVSRNTIATYETSVRVPIDAILISICREFNVNEKWLRSGEGSIYVETSPDITLSKWFGQILREEPDSFKKKFVVALSRLTEGEWKTLENIVNSLLVKGTTE